MNVIREDTIAANMQLAQIPLHLIYARASLATLAMENHV